MSICFKILKEKKFWHTTHTKNVDKTFYLESVPYICTYSVPFCFLLFYFLKRNHSQSHIDQFQVYMGFHILGFGYKLIFYWYFFLQLSGSSSF